MQIDDCLALRAGRLQIERCDAAELADRFGTPLYVVSEDQLRRRARAFTEAFGAAWPHGPVRVLPSIKANYALALRAVLSSEGLGCDCFGPGELEAALRAGTPPELVSLNGSSKDRALIERAVAAGVRITADSAAELALAAEAAARLDRPAQVRVRVRPELRGAEAPSDLFADEVSVRDAVARYKPGIPTADLLALRPPAGVELTGVMMHIGRHGADPRLWAAAIASLAGVVAALRDAWDGWEPAEIDVSGGFPLPRDPTGRTLARRQDAAPPPPLERYAEAIGGALAPELAAAGIDPAGRVLEVEPGRSLYGDAGVHLTRVLGVKREGEFTWVETDTSEAFLPDGLLEHNRWTVVAASDGPAVLTADVVGRSCTFDVIVADATLPAVEPGDVLAVLDTGAYQDAGASNFNAMPRPGTVLVRGREAELVRRAETPDDVFARDLVPARLLGERTAKGGGGVTRLDHVSVSCADVDRSLVFYRDLLGLPLRDRGAGPSGAVGEITGVGDAEVEWADLALPDGRVLELLRLPGGPPAAGSGHFALGVAEADAIHRRLREAGVPLRSEPVMIDDPGDWQGARCFYAEDPDGTVVELIQRAS
jgi:diaminopimelate decarboxylase